MNKKDLKKGDRVNFKFDVGGESVIVKNGEVLYIKDWGQANIKVGACVYAINVEDIIEKL